MGFEIYVQKLTLYRGFYSIATIVIVSRVTYFGSDCICVNFHMCNSETEEELGKIDENFDVSG